MRRVVLSASLLSAILLGLTFVPDLHRSLETVSLLRPLLIGVCLLGVAFVKSRVARGGLLAAALIGSGTVWAAVPTVNDDPGLRVYSKNINKRNGDTAPIWRDIEASGVDVVVLQEVSDANIALMEELAETFPHQHVCQSSPVQNIALASRFPFESAPVCSERRAIAVAQVAVPSGVVSVGAIHAPWPWPNPNVTADIALHAALEALPQPAIVVGDFNTLPWSTRMERVQQSTGLVVAGPMRVTWRRPDYVIPLPLDHALGPHGGSIEVRPRFGSDHHGIVATLPLEP